MEINRRVIKKKKKIEMRKGSGAYYTTRVVRCIRGINEAYYDE